MNNLDDNIGVQILAFFVAVLVVLSYWWLL